jgi:hypothetical protein
MAHSGEAASCTVRDGSFIVTLEGEHMSHNIIIL